MSKKVKNTPHMSAEELKLKLYTHFRNNGSMDKFRTQLRKELVSELFKVAEPTALSKTQSTQIEAENNRLLPLQVSNWLVYDHLQRQGYDYTLSTFISESNVSYPERFLTIYDILDLFGFKNDTEEYQHLSEIYFETAKHNFLHSLLLTLIKSSFGDFIKTKSTHAVVERNTAVDQENVKNFLTNSNETEKEHCFFSEANRVVSDVKHIQTHQKVAEQQLHFFKQKSEREVQNLRQKLFEELDGLHSREDKMRVDLEQSKLQLAREREQLLIERNKIKQKQSMLELDFEKEIEAKLKAAEEYISSRLHSKEKELENWEQNMKSKEQKALEEKGKLNVLQTENESLIKELKEQKEINKSFQEKYSSLLADNTNLVKKFESMSDYSVLKSEVSSKSSEILYLKQEVTGMQQRAEVEKNQLLENLKSLQQTLKEKNPKLILAEQELSLMRNNFHAEHQLWNEQKDKLEQEVFISKRLYETVIQRLEEQKEDIQDLHRTIHILHYQLTNKETPATEAHADKPSTSFPFQRNSTEPARSYEQHSRFRSFPSLGKNSVFRTDKDPLKFISDAKKKIGELQREADAVKNKYSMLFNSSAAPERNQQESCSYTHLKQNQGAVHSSMYFLSPTKRTSISNSNLFDKIDNISSLPIGFHTIGGSPDLSEIALSSKIALNHFPSFSTEITNSKSSAKDPFPSLADNVQSNTEMTVDLSKTAEDTMNPSNSSLPSKQQKELLSTLSNLSTSALHLATLKARASNKSSPSHSKQQNELLSTLAQHSTSGFSLTMLRSNTANDSTEKDKHAAKTVEDHSHQSRESKIEDPISIAQNPIVVPAKGGIKKSNSEINELVVSTSSSKIENSHLHSHQSSESKAEGKTFEFTQNPTVAPSESSIVEAVFSTINKHQIDEPTVSTRNSKSLSSNFPIAPLAVDLDAAWKTKAHSDNSDQMKNVHLAEMESTQTAVRPNEDQDSLIQGTSLPVGSGDGIANSNELGTSLEIINRIASHSSKQLESTNIFHNDQLNTLVPQVNENESNIKFDQNVVNQELALEEISNDNMLHESKADILDKSIPVCQENLAHSEDIAKEHLAEASLSEAQEHNIENRNVLQENQQSPSLNRKNYDTCVILTNENSKTTRTETNNAESNHEEVINELRNVPEQTVIDLVGETDKKEEADEMEGSASELSEVKLSCGSEQEQKDEEDSDFW